MADKIETDKKYPFVNTMREMSRILTFIFLLNNFVLIFSDESQVYTNNVFTPKAFMCWPNATVPFYINPHHFDHEQALTIMTTLSMFAFKSCVKFVPVMAAPEGDQHVLVFENPEAVRRCKIATSGHSIYGPHSVILGYECLQSPQIDMVIMKSLGFPFEHNRASRDVFIEVLVENIEPGSMELFTKDDVLPVELRSLPYDINSVMHFGERDFSKNGHRTIIFKDRKNKQQRKGLSATDIRKIETVYGPECRKRDRQEKIELCQSYPGVARRKREVTTESKSLRVNPDITPPPEVENAATPDESRAEDQDSIRELKIDDEVQLIVEHTHKVSALALKNARQIYCNASNNDSQVVTEDKKQNSTDLLGVIKVISDYAKSVVDHAVSNLTIFCEESEDLVKYQRKRGPCGWNDNSDRCRMSYRSTKSGAVRYSTQHRPTYIQSTKHYGRGKQWQGVKVGYRRMDAVNNSDTTTEGIKNKRDREDGQNSSASQINKAVSPVNIPQSEKITSRDNIETTKSLVVTHTFVWKEYDNVSELPENNLGKDLNNTRNKTISVPVTVSESSAASQKTVGAETPMKQSRRKRDINSEDKTPEAVVMNANTTVDDKGQMKESNSSKKRSVMTTKSDSVKVKAGEQRFFQGRRFRSKNPKGKNAKVEWDDSAVSIEETHQNEKKHRQKSEESDESEEIEVREPENAKKKEERFEMEDKQRSEGKRKGRGTTPKTVKMSKLNAEFYNERKWPDAEVRYVLQPNPLYDLNDVRRRLGAVNSILKRRTCVKLVELTEDEATNYIDYLYIDNSPDYVTGRVGGKQNFGAVELFRGGQHRQHAAMMVMAMLGFYFEVSRHDRDKHIRVHMRHVRPDKLHHFEKIREDATLDLPYDYNSATHPAWQFWRKIGKTGISTVATFKEHDPDGSIMKGLGQNEELLSELDIVKINSVYGVKCFQNTRSKNKKVEWKEE